MRETRVPRLLSATIGAGAVGVAVVAGLQLGQDPSGAGHDAAIGGARRSPSPSPTPTPTPTPSPTLEELDTADTPFPTPSFPDPPGKSSAELDRIGYQLRKVAWTSAGYVDPDTDTDCSVSEDDLIETGSYDFTCTVSFDDVKTSFAVTAKVKEKKVYWDYSAKKLPVSEKKATYELTRQAFEPARATCNLVGTEPVRVGDKKALRCWVTTADNTETTYEGELVPDGSLIFRPDS